MLAAHGAKIRRKTIGFWPRLGVGVLRLRPGQVLGPIRQAIVRVIKKADQLFVEAMAADAERRIGTIAVFRAVEGFFRFMWLLTFPTSRIDAVASVWPAAGVASCVIGVLPRFSQKEAPT